MAGKLEQLWTELIDVKPVLPGSISEQYNVCGKAGCRCKDKINPRKHGPQSRLSYSLPGENSTLVIRKGDVPVAREMTANYGDLRKVVASISTEAIRIYREEGAQALYDQMQQAILQVRSRTVGQQSQRGKLLEVEASRGRWKAKAKSRAKELRQAGITIRDLTQSRDKWRQEALSSRRELESLRQAEQRATAAVEDQAGRIRHLEADLKKTTPPD